jgi:hypothetical protein
VPDVIHWLFCRGGTTLTGSLRGPKSDGSPRAVHFIAALLLRRMSNIATEPAEYVEADLEGEDE